MRRYRQELYALKNVCQQTGGRYDVAMGRSHFEDVASEGWRIRYGTYVHTCTEAQPWVFLSIGFSSDMAVYVHVYLSDIPHGRAGGDYSSIAWRSDSIFICPLPALHSVPHTARF